jgi:hypothetical protein
MIVDRDLTRIDGDDLHRPRLPEFDELSIRKTPHGVVHPRLWNVGSVGDLAGGELAVFQDGQVGVDLVVAQIEPVADRIERLSEVICHTTP